jgi:Uma2 family endonuclease
VQPARKLHYTYEQYLEIERRSDVRHEYLNGEIYALAGGTPEHAFLAAQVIHLLGRALPPACRMATSDLKISVEGSGLYTYPDAAIICGQAKFDVRDRQAVVNPTVLVEVTSESTEDYDRGAKLLHYQSISSLQCLIIVSHRQPLVTVFRRATDEWKSANYGPGTVAELDGPVQRLEVESVYSVISNASA